LRFWGGSRIVAISRVKELLDLVRRDGRGWGLGWGWSWVFASGVLVDGWMDGEVVLLVRRRGLLIKMDVRVEISRPTPLGF